MTVRDRREPEALAADLAAEREALRETLYSLRQRLTAQEMVREGIAALGSQKLDGAVSSVSGALASGLCRLRRSPATPWLAGAAVAGLALAAWARKARADAEEVPHWLSDIRRASERADELLATIDVAREDGRLSALEHDEARAEIDRALEIDTRRALLRGLEGLSPEEKQAALSVREARLKRDSGGPSPLAGALMLACAAGAAALATQLAGGGAAPDPLDELRSDLDDALRRLDEGEERYGER